MKKPKKKIIYKEDDGRTIYSMDSLDKSFYRNKNKYSNDENKIVLTKKEKKAMRKAAFVSLLPMLISILIGFGLVYLLIWFWLK